MGFLTTLQVDLPHILCRKDKHNPGHTSHSSMCRLGPTHISELDQTQLPKLSHAAVGSLHLQEELHQAHLLAPEDRGHFAYPPPTWASVRALLAEAEGVKRCGNIGISE